MKSLYLNTRKLIAFMGTFLLLVMMGCSGENERNDLDTTTSGVLRISVDESFKPVIDSQIQVFEALNPKAKIIADYKSEAACLEDFKTDSTKLIIITRGLNKEEEQYYKKKFSVYPKWSKVANDGLAIIINNSDKDSLFTMAKIRGILSGTTGDKQNAVFDGLEGSSGFRYAQDSILKGVPIDMSRVFGEKSSEDVIEFIEKNKRTLTVES